MAPTATLTIAQRRQLVQDNAGDIFLNGEPAVIAGVYNDFATVASLSSPLSVEFSWLTVEHIIDTKEGMFRA